MNNSIILKSISEFELRTIIAEVVAEQLSTFLSETREKKSAKLELLTRKDTAGKLGISLPTLHKWTLNGTIQAKRLGSGARCRIRYCIDDIEAVLKDIHNPKKK
ncbi:MAG: hypothetical protein E6772_14530 [Dysgonomonas sp.]|nr:hypothetical protein [Dysgonomonas sp.]